MTKDYNQQSKNSEQSLNKGIKERNGLTIGIAIGFAVWLPFMFLSTELMSKTINSIFIGVLIGLLVVVVLVLIIYLFRNKILSNFFGNVGSSVDSVKQSAITLINSKNDREKTSEATSQIISESLAVVSWFFARRALLTILIGMVGSVVAMMGTIILLKQTEVLDLQANKLQRQNEIMAGEGKWEKHWLAYNSEDEETRLEAATDLIKSEGMELKGLGFSGSIRPRSNPLVRGKPHQMFGMERDYRELTSLDDSVVQNISCSELLNFSLFLNRWGSNYTDFRDMSYNQCFLFIENPQHIYEANFQYCVFYPQQGNAYFIDCFIDQTFISSIPMGSWSFTECKIRNLGIDGSGTSRDLTGIPIDTSRAIGGMTEAEYPLFFQKCNISNILVEGPSLVGFRACIINHLEVSGESLNEKNLELVLNELIAKDCLIESIAIGVTYEIDNETIFESNDILTKLAEKWVKTTLNTFPHKHYHY